jgi:hypothetical protein
MFREHVGSVQIGLTGLLAILFAIIGVAAGRFCYEFGWDYFAMNSDGTVLGAMLGFSP